MTHHFLDRTPTTLRLQAALETGVGFPVGLGAAPRKMVGSTLTAVAAPYLILYSLWTTTSGPAFGADRHADAEWVYQITLAALRGDQLEGMRDKALSTVLGKLPDGAYLVDLDTAGAKIIERDLKDDNGSSEPVGSTMPADLRVSLHATPLDT